MKKQLTITCCPNCGSDEIEKVCRDWTGNYREQSYTVPKLEFYECPVCHEHIFDTDAITKIREHSPAYRQPQKADRGVPLLEAIPA